MYSINRYGTEKDQNKADVLLKRAIEQGNMSATVKNCRKEAQY